MKERSNLPYYLVLFLISPVLSLLSGMANFRDRSSKLIMVLFLGVFGFTMILHPGKDSYSQAITFVEVYSLMSFSEFQEILISILTLGGGKQFGAGADELYFPILAYSLAQFTSSTSILFLMIGLVYGLFYIKGMALVYNDLDRKWSVAVLILFVFYISWISIDGINGIRTWTGGWIYFIGVYLYFKTTDKRYILLVMLAPLFHFGYLLFTVPFYLYLIFKDMRYLYLALAIFSMMFSSSLEFIEPYITATDLGEQKFDAYTSDRFIGEHQDDSPRSFHAEYAGFAARWSLQILFLYSIIFLGYLKKENHDRFLTSLGSFSLIMFSFANFAGVVPVLGNRATLNFGIYALAYITVLYSQLPKGYKGREYLVYFFTPAILLFLFTKYSMIGDYMDFRVLISPLAYPLLGDDPVSMKEFIRMILDV